MRVHRVLAAVAVSCLVGAPSASASITDCSRGAVGAANPYFDLDAAGWASSTGTTVSRTMAGLGLWKRSGGLNLAPGDTLHSYIAGQVFAGHGYTASFEAKVTGSNSSSAARPIIRANFYGADSGASVNVRASTMTAYAIHWTPTADDCPDFRLDAVGFDNASVTIDNLVITTCPPYGEKWACTSSPEVP